MEVVKLITNVMILLMKLVVKVDYWIVLGILNNVFSIVVIRQAKSITLI